MYSSDAIHVARGASYIVIQNTVSYAGMAVSFAILARLIAPSEMGILAVLQLLNGLCQVIATFGLPQAATKFIAENLPRGEKETISSVLYQAVRTTFLLAVPLGLAAFLGAKTLSIQLLGDSHWTILFQVLAIDIPLYAGLIPVLAGAMLGLQKFKEMASIGIANTVLRQSLIILLILFLQSFLGLVIAWVISDLAIALIYIAYLSKTVGSPRFNFPVGKLLGFSWPLSIGNAISFGYSWFDRALLLIFVPLATLGIYNATMTAFAVLVGAAGAVGGTLFPAYSAYMIHDSHQRETAAKALRMASRYISLVGVPLALGLMATAKPALALFVGQAYVEGAGPLMILAGTFAFTLVGTVLSPMLLALGETRAASAITILSVAASLAAAFVLLPISGMLGASIARGFAMILATALTVLILSKKLSLRLDLEAVSKSLIAGIIMAAAVFFMQISIYNRLLLPAYAFVGVIVYLAMLRLLKAARQEDVDLLRSYLGGRLALVPSVLEKILLSSRNGRPADLVK